MFKVLYKLILLPLTFEGFSYSKRCRRPNSTDAVIKESLVATAVVATRVAVVALVDATTPDVAFVSLMPCC